VAPLIALDIENHEDMTLACLGVAVSDREAFVIPTPAPLAGWQRSAVAALCALNVPKAFQNGGYDRYFLRKFCDIEVRNHAFDTMLAWHTLQPELAGKTMKPRGRRTTAKSLRFLASIYTRAPFWKDYAFSSENERYELCGKDCCVTLEVAAKMAEELDHG
jgi:DNA polymerase I-like protein with 3'-5' exonuclease and polymerase domains